MLVRHGDFSDYYERTFRKPHGIPFRTAQSYMQAARKEAKDNNCADSALFPAATDPQAVEIREVTEKHRLAVAGAEPESSDDMSSSAEEQRSGRSEKSGESICVCRLSLRVTQEQKARIAELWNSEHRVLAESVVTDFLIELCRRYDSGSGSEEADA